MPATGDEAWPWVAPAPGRRRARVDPRHWVAPGPGWRRPLCGSGPRVDPRPWVAPAPVRRRTPAAARQPSASPLLLPEDRRRGPPDALPGVAGLHGHELEDLDGEPALALGQEGVPVGERTGAINGTGLDDRVAVQVAGLRARSVVADRGARPERRPAVGQRRTDPPHPGLPGLHLPGGLL